MTSKEFRKKYLKDTFWEDTKKLSEEQLSVVTEQRSNDLKELLKRPDRDRIIDELLVSLFGEEIKEDHVGFFALKGWVKADWRKVPRPRIPSSPEEARNYNYLLANQDKVFKIAQVATDYIYGEGHNGEFIYATSKMCLKDFEGRTQPKADPITLAIPQEIMDKINNAEKYPYMTVNNRLYYACKIDGKIAITSTDVADPNRPFAPMESTYALITAGNLPQTISRLSLRPDPTPHEDPSIVDGKLETKDGMPVIKQIKTQLAHLHSDDWISKATCPSYYSYRVIANDFMDLKATNDEVMLNVNARYNMNSIYSYDFDLNKEKGVLSPSKGVFDIDPSITEVAEKLPLNSIELFNHIKETRKEIIKSGKLDFSNDLTEYLFDHMNPSPKLDPQEPKNKDIIPVQ